MPIHRSKSRVQFRVATKKTEKQKAVITEEKHPKIKAPTGSKAVPKDSGIAPKAYRRKPIVRFASEDDEVEDVIYEDSDEDEGMFNFELSPSLCKKQLPTTEETKGMGVLKGNIKATMTATTTSPTVEYDWPEDPPASLILDLPVYVQSGEQLQFALTIQPPAPFQKAPSSNSRSALQTVVDLFAGQKKPPTVKKIGDKNYREVTRGPTNSNPVSEHVLQTIQDATSGPSAASSPSPPLPRLTIPQAIPDILVPGTTDLSKRPGFVRISPAPEHRYNGYAVISPDLYSPVVVQKGFDVISTPPHTPIRRTNSAANILDRDGNTWVNYHSKCPSLEHQLFARVHLGRDRRTQNTSSVSGVHLQVPSMGHCVLEHAGDHYPCIQGLCW